MGVGGLAGHGRMQGRELVLELWGVSTGRKGQKSKGMCKVRRTLVMDDVRRFCLGTAATLKTDICDV